MLVSFTGSFVGNEVYPKCDYSEQLFPIPHCDDLKYSLQWQFLTLSMETELKKKKKRLDMYYQMTQQLYPGCLFQTNKTYVHTNTCRLMFIFLDLQWPKT